MSTKVNSPKYILGVVMVALLVIGGWATTTARLTTTKTAASTAAKVAPTQPRSVSPAPLGTDSLGSVFELDGDITDPDTALPDDWSTVNCGGGNALAKSFVHDGLNVSIFTGGGSKDPDLLSSWRHKDGSVPPKDEIINAYAAKYLGATNDNILVFGADRYTNNGSAFIGFWFFQGPVFAAADGRFRQGPLATDPIAVHQIGDILILIEFSQGGAVATTRVLEWVGTGGTEAGGTLNDITLTAPAGSVFAISNIAPQTIPASCTAWQYTPQGGAPGDPIPVNSFFEGGINLDAFPALSGSCFSSFMVETRSSPSTTATLKDFALGQLNTCPHISVTKTAFPTEACAGTPVSYTYSVTNPAGASVTVNATLVDDNGTPTDTSDDFCVVPPSPTGACGIFTSPVGNGSCSFTLAPGETKTCTRSQVVLPVGITTNIVTATATSGSFTDTATATATVTIHANPTCSVTPSSATICATGSQTFTANPSGGTGPYTYLWSPGGATTSSITVTAAGTYSVVVTDSFLCVSPGCSATLSVNPTPTCSISGNDPVCGGSTNTYTSTVLPAGGTVTHSWSISGGGGTIQGSTTGSSVQVLAAASGSYTLTDHVTRDGCPSTSDCTKTVTVTANPSAAVATPAAQCAGLSGTTTFLLDGTAANGSSAWSIVGVTGTITNADVSFSAQTATDTNVSILNGKTGTATLRLTVTSTSCGSASADVTVTVNPNPVVGITATACGTTITLTAGVTSGTAPFGYVWTVPAGVTNPGNVASFGATVAGSYSVTVTDASGCSGARSATVGVCLVTTGTASAPSPLKVQTGVKRRRQ